MSFFFVGSIELISSLLELSEAPKPLSEFHRSLPQEYLVAVSDLCNQEKSFFRIFIGRDWKTSIIRKRFGIGSVITCILFFM